MRWKSVALVGALAPAITGCNIAYTAARNVVQECRVTDTQIRIERELVREARAAWLEVRIQYPQRTFSDEFRDGFLDGYVDYLDRGGNGSLPAVPPVKYTHQKKYFTEEGQCLVKEYFLGFKYGQEIAIIFGDRRSRTVPVLLPETPITPAAFHPYPSGGSTPGELPNLPLGTPGLPSPTELLPNPRPLLPPETSEPPLGKPAPLLLPPLPGNPKDRVGPVGKSSGLPLPTIPIAPDGTIPPPPPPAVPTVSTRVATPPGYDDLPVLPPNYAMPQPLPPNHPTPREMGDPPKENE